MSQATAVNRLEFMHQQATSEISGLPPLATEPACFFRGDARRLQEHITIDTQGIVDFMTSFGTPPEQLGRMAIRFMPHFEGRRGRTARVLCNPAAIDDQTYYPVIDFETRRQRDTSHTELNFNLRHELRHLMQDPDEQWREMRREPLTILAACIPTAFPVMLSPYLVPPELAAQVSEVTSPEMLQLGGIGALAVSAVAGYAMMQKIASVVHRQFLPTERDANRFARDHADFQPITLR